MDKQSGLAHDLKLAYDELQTLSGEIRVQLHLATMDAKDAWTRDLEPRLFSLEKRLESEVSDATRSAVHDLRDAMRAFRDGMRKN